MNGGRVGGWDSRRLLTTCLVALLAASAGAFPAVAAGGRWSSSDAERTPSAPSSPRDSSSSPDRYLAHALDVLQNRDVFSGRVDWVAERQKLTSMLSQHPSLAAARQLVVQALADLNDAHGAVLPPGDGTTPSQAAGALVLPHGRMLPHAIGYVSLPAVSGGPASRAAVLYGSTGEQVIRSLAHRGASAWIVDLRWNTGGDMYPMLVAIGALLDPGRVIGFQPPHGERTWITYDRTAFYANGGKVVTAPQPEPRLPHHPLVTLLTSAQTASSGEATLIAFLGQHNAHTFGQATFGLPNAPTVLPLGDGYQVRYSAEDDVDRTGRVYNGPVNPDHRVDEPSTFTPGDPELTAAVRWIRSRQQRGERLAAVGVAAGAIALLGLALGLAHANLRQRRTRAHDPTLSQLE